MREPAGKPRITLAKVARDAGVSIATVSLILGNRTGWIEQFHPDTIQKVRASAEKLGYRRNLFASGLPSGGPPFFALVLTETEADREGWHNWAFQGALLEAVNAAAERNGIHTVVATMHAQGNPGRVERIAAIVDGGVFGAIFRTPGPGAEELIRARMSTRRPVIVLFPRHLATWPTNAIGLDDAAAGRIAGQLLAAQKRRSWVLVCREQMTEAHRLRCDGFTQVAREVGAAVTAIELPAATDEDGWARLLASHLVRLGSDGLFAVDASTSTVSVLGCLRGDLSLGSDCAVVGCEILPHTTPGLPRITSVGIPWHKAGVLAVEQLLRARDSKRRFKTLLLKPHVVEGDSCPVPRRLLSERPCSVFNPGGLLMAV